jgi:DNA-binding NarL/FixJ family response regulator
MIRIAIADDHKMFVGGIESLLATQHDVKVVAKCYDGNAVFDMLANHEADVILLDIDLPGLNGMDVCKRLRSEYPSLRVLVISMYNEESFITELLNNGATGYVLKDTEVDDLITAIKTVHKGETYFSKEVTETIMRSLMKRQKGQSATNLGGGLSVSGNNTLRKNNLPVISRREKEILQLIVDEHSTQEIAAKLFISPKTVEVHRSNLLAKLNARNTAGLVRAAIENGLV